QHLPGRTGAPAAVLPASGAGMGQVQDADPRLLAVRRGNAPGRRHHGRFGPSGRARDAEERPMTVRTGNGSAGNGVFDAAVIGGGANGLVAATVLARGGMRVVLVERGATLGGQGQLVEFAPGFRAAPLGDPGWLPRPVAAALGNGRLERA